MGRCAARRAAAAVVSVALVPRRSRARPAFVAGVPSPRSVRTFAPAFPPGFEIRTGAALPAFAARLELGARAALFALAAWRARRPVPAFPAPRACNLESVRSTRPFGQFPSRVDGPAAARTGLA
jgi:hypothetical protein